MGTSSPWNRPHFLTSVAPPFAYPEGSFSILRGCGWGSNLSGALGGAWFPVLTSPAEPSSMLTIPLLLPWAMTPALLLPLLPHAIRVSALQLYPHPPCSNPNPGDFYFTFGASSQSGSQVQGYALSPFSSASVPISPPLSFLASLSLIHSPNITPAPATRGCLLCPKATGSHQFRYLRQGCLGGDPTGTLTLAQESCCSGIHLPQQAGRSRRAVPGVNTSPPPLPLGARRLQ